MVQGGRGGWRRGWGFGWGWWNPDATCRTPAIVHPHTHLGTMHFASIWNMKNTTIMAIKHSEQQQEREKSNKISGLETDLFKSSL